MLMYPYNVMVLLFYFSYIKGREDYLGNKE